MSEYLLDYFDLVSGIMTDAYLAEAKLLLAQHARARVALVEDLMHGRQPGDLEARELCERCGGLRSGAHIAVAIARPLSATPGDGTDRDAVLSRVSELVETSLSARGFGTLVDRRDGAVLAIAASEADTARSMANVLHGCVAEQRQAAGASVGIGISLDVSDIAAVPQAYQEAERAIDFAEPRRPVVHVADVELVELLLRVPIRRPAPHAQMGRPLPRGGRRESRRTVTHYPRLRRLQSQRQANGAPARTAHQHGLFPPQPDQGAGRRRSTQLFRDVSVADHAAPARSEDKDRWESALEVTLWRGQHPLGLVSLAIPPLRCAGALHRMSG